uniref:Fungal lipase-like domain-containing protein n=1 Tax=Plectus sambesii TaxID=2011161 RepID=A0A914X2F3_9BILA
MAKLFLVSVQAFIFIEMLCDAAAVNYDEKLAKKMLSMSAAAYFPSSNNCLKTNLLKEDEWKHSHSADNKCDILASTCAAYIAISDKKKQIAVAFRGTTTKSQLLLQAIDSLSPGEEFFGIGFVHQYFKNGLSEVWASVNKTLAAPKTKDYEVLFTGHSLGGALASLAAVLTVKLGFRPSDKVKMFSFGQPRVGDSTFAFTYDRLVPFSFRIVNKGDIVSHVPKCIWGDAFYAGSKFRNRNNVTGELPQQICISGPEDSYYHHGTEVWYPEGMGKNAKYVVCSGNPKNEDIACSDGLYHKETGFTTADHYPYFVQDVWQFGQDDCKE